METYLKNLPSFPLSDPYSFAPLNTNFIHVSNPIVAQINNSQILSTNGKNAIVDWIFIELRHNTKDSVLFTKSALLQADGDIVKTDGITPFSFTEMTNSGSYFIAIRFKNNLGFRTLNPISISNSMNYLNFSNNSIQLYGSTPLETLITLPVVAKMIGGDANFDGSIDAFDTIMWEAQNGLFDDYILNTDYNFDSSVDAFDSIIWEINNGKFEEL